MSEEGFEFEYNALQEMLIVNYRENFSYSMNNEDDVYSVAEKLNEQQDTIDKLKEENEALKKFIKDNFNEMMDSKMLMDSITSYGDDK